MSTQNEFNTKAIELTHDELKDIVGGATKARSADLNSLIAAYQAQNGVTRQEALQAANAEIEAAHLRGANKTADAFKNLLH